MNSSDAAAKRNDPPVNGIAPDDLREMTARVAHDPKDSKATFRVRTEWKGGLKSDSHVTLLEIGRRQIARRFVVRMDEPPEFFGADTGPNPQEMLMAAFNACLMSGYVAGCALEGIEIAALAIETEGQLDLRGFLGLDVAIRPGYEEISYVVRIRSNGTPEQLQKVHEQVLATSPNRWNIANTVRLKTQLLAEYL